MCEYTHESLRKLGRYLVLTFRLAGSFFIGGVIRHYELDLSGNLAVPSAMRPELPEKLQLDITLHYITYKNVHIYNIYIYIHSNHSPKYTPDFSPYPSAPLPSLVGCVVDRGACPRQCVRSFAPEALLSPWPLQQKLGDLIHPKGGNSQSLEILTINVDLTKTWIYRI